jgi:hypothetical protein
LYFWTILKQKDTVIYLDVHNLPWDRVRGYGMGYLKDFSTMFQGIPGFAAMFFGVFRL